MALVRTSGGVLQDGTYGTGAPSNIAFTCGRPRTTNVADMLGVEDLRRTS